MGFIDWLIKKQLKKRHEIIVYDSDGNKKGTTYHLFKPIYDRDPVVAEPKKYLQDAVLKPDKFKWFKCRCCGDKKYASKGDYLFYFQHREYYSNFKTKWCRDCVMDVAYAMKATDEDFKRAERRIMLRKLAGKGKE